MPINRDVQHSILIVSASEQFVALVKKSLKNCSTIDSRKSGALARRAAIEKKYDLVVINIPLIDETGEELALDIAEKSDASIMMAVPREVFDIVLEHVTDHGIIVLPKPVTGGAVDKALRFMSAIQNKIHRLEKKNRRMEEKMAEIRTVSKAKLCLVERKGMTEDEAHRFIGRQAMNNGVSRMRIAVKILEDLGL